MSAPAPDPAREGARAPAAPRAASWAAAPDREPPSTPPLAPRARAARIALAWGALVVATPGVVARDGSALAALVGVALWAAAARRPGPRAFVVEWAIAGLGSAAVCVWSAYVWVGTLAFIAIVPGLYHAAAGALLRRLAPRATLALAAPAAWTALELARTLAEPPFGYGWQRLGHHLAATPLAGSARVWGTYGLGFALAAAAGALVELARRPTAVGDAVPLARRLLRAAPGLVPPIAALVLAHVVPAPASEPGPRLLLVQPAVEQRRKMTLPDPEVLFLESLELTRKGLAEARASGGGPIDLVAWGETMLPFPLIEEGLERAYAAGARSPAWTRDVLTSDALAWTRDLERAWIGRELYGGPLLPGVLPPGAAFLSGAEVFVERDGALRRTNAVVLWDRDGARAALGGKLHLVPGAEHLAGLERLGWVRSAAFAVAGYVPDLVAFERTAVFELLRRGDAEGGARPAWRFGVSICFDNAFDDPYTAPLRAGPLDFHLVASNEAWYRSSFEVDQMVAFSRLHAIQTGRSFVRATNSGITLVLGPDGAEVARLVRGGRDRMVPGTLAATVPVPVDPDARTPYVRLEQAWLVLWLVLPALVGALRRPGRRRERA